MPERNAMGRYTRDIDAAQGHSSGDFSVYSNYGTTTSAEEARRPKTWGQGARLLKKGESNLTDEELFGDED